MYQIVNTFDIQQVFGRKEIKKEFGYGDSKAGRMLSLLEEFQIIESLTGKGKGKYIFKVTK